MSQDNSANQPANPNPPEPRKERPAPQPSQDETDLGWNEQPEPTDEERFNRDRPPHWETG